jgi:hypothetical protein
MFYKANESDDRFLDALVRKYSMMTTTARPAGTVSPFITMRISKIHEDSRRFIQFRLRKAKPAWVNVKNIPFAVSCSALLARTHTTHTTGRHFVTYSTIT